MGLSAYFVMSGPLAHLRVWLFPVEMGAATPQGLSQAAQSIGLDPVLIGVVLGCAILIFALARREMRDAYQSSQDGWAHIGLRVWDLPPNP